MKNLRKELYWLIPAAIMFVVTAFIGRPESDAICSILPLLLGAAGSIGASLIAAGANASAAERAQMMNDKGVQEWLKINIPDPAQQKLALEHFVQQGKLTPELENAVKLEDTQLNKIQTDPALKESRMRSLRSLEEQGYGGESVTDEAAQQKNLIDSGVKSRGQQEAILSSMERRGQLGTGLELAGRLDAGQAEGDRAATQALNLEGQRRQRGLQAIEAAGSAAGKIQGDEYGIAKDRAAAADVIRAYNAKNTQAVGNANVLARNDASKYNLTSAQTVADKNTAVDNYEQEKNNDLYQKQFDNEAKKAAGVAGQYKDAATLATEQGKNTANIWGTLGQGAAKLGTAAYGALKDEEEYEE